jgi:hypothetical protein
METNLRVMDSPEIQNYRGTYFLVPMIRKSVFGISIKSQMKKGIFNHYKHFYSTKDMLKMLLGTNFLQISLVQLVRIDKSFFGIPSRVKLHQQV